MLKNSKYYILDDSGKLGFKGLLEAPEDSLKDYNDKGCGVFYSVNQFDGPRRRENLIKINAWYCDIDGDKQMVRKKLEGCPIYPSIINETRNGFHLLWLARDASEQNYKDVMKGIVKYFDGDGLYDTTRVLRVPGYYWNKDLDNPYLVQNTQNIVVYYNEEDMKRAYPYKKPIKPLLSGFNFRKVSDDNPIQRLRHTPVRDGLEKLSGSDWVDGDVYEFIENGNGTTQIVVNGDPSSSWIDRNGKIGSHKRYGPNLYSWLKWYKDKKGVDLIVERVLKEVIENETQTN
jgi:hypothetical protein